MKRLPLLILASLAGAAQINSAVAETMSGALARAYSGNPNINQQRAAVRVSDENVPAAKAGWLPQINGQIQAGRLETIDEGSASAKSYSSTGRYKRFSDPRTLNLVVNQMIFDGFKTANSVRGAQSGVMYAREQARSVEISTLLAGATYYMDVMRDTAIVGLRKNNIEVLEVQLHQTEDRFKVGEVTRTDVSQAQAALALARAQLAQAQSTLQTSVANYRMVIGCEPKNLSPAQPIERLLPSSLETALVIATDENPSIVAARHAVDSAQAAVKVAEAALSPTLSVQGAVSQQYDYGGIQKTQLTSASVMGVLNVPIYEGGAEYANVRQAKEKLGQARLQVDVQQNQVRESVVSTWGQLQSARQAIVAYQASVNAAELALNGVREEARVGQRTTYDVLNAQYILLNARVDLVSAQHDRVVASYAVFASTGQLSAHSLGLGVTAYDPSVHYNQVKNKFIGLHTPEGR